VVLSSHALQPSCCAVILAGGLNSRMGGTNKAFLEVGGKTILERLLHALSGPFEEILLVTRKPELYKDLPVRVVTDIYDARSSLTGIHAGLKHCRSDYAFIVPCDAPFIQIDLINYLLNQIDPELDVIVPVIDDHYEPLCAIYSKRCIAPIEEQLDRHDFTIIHFFDRIRLKKISTEAIQATDRRMLSFFNVNTPEVLRHSQRLADKT
jgi:molybdopterin-guanine dinucleotide biosynthesis protein A